MHETKVQRTLKRSGITKISNKNRLLITKEHEETGLFFVKHWNYHTLKDVWIIHECVFQLHRNKVLVARLPKPSPMNFTVYCHAFILAFSFMFITYAVIQWSFVNE